MLRLAAPIGLAFVPLGMALGLLIVHAGLAWWWAPVFAAVIYAGSLEFLMVGLAATAAPVAAVALTTFIVNSRHVFYALSFPLDRVDGVRGQAVQHLRAVRRGLRGGGVRRGAIVASRQILLMQCAFHLIWTASSALGGLVGEALPIERLRGLDFALTALFIVLAIDAYRQRPDRLTALSAAGCAVAAWMLAPGQLLVCAFAAFTGVLLVRFARAAGEDGACLTPAHIALLVAVSAAVTWALRIVPFAVLAPMRHSAVVKYLCVHMPVGVMVMLALYTLRHAPESDARELGWLLIAVAVTVGLHLWRGHALVSILAGTAVYVVLMSAFA